MLNRSSTGTAVLILWSPFGSYRLAVTDASPWVKLSRCEPVQLLQHFALRVAGLHTTDWPPHHLHLVVCTAAVSVTFALSTNEFSLAFFTIDHMFWAISKYSSCILYHCALPASTPMASTPPPLGCLYRCCIGNGTYVRDQEQHLYSFWQSMNLRLCTRKWQHVCAEKYGGAHHIYARILGQFWH